MGFAWLAVKDACVYFAFDARITVDRLEPGLNEYLGTARFNADVWCLQSRILLHLPTGTVSTFELFQSQDP